jgi:RND family efflux transporter MFP subunit
MTTQTRIDLNDLKIAEKPARRSGGRWPVVILVVLLPVAFALGWTLNGSGSALPGTSRTVTVEVVRADGAGPASRGGFGEGGWVEVPSYHPLVVSALVPGRVEELLVLEGSPVTAGQVVARLYAQDLTDAVRLKDAAVAEAKAALALMNAGYRKEEVAKASAVATRLEAELALAEKVAERTANLVPAGAASAEELEQDRSACEVARAALQVAREEQARLNAGFRVEEVQQARAALDRAEADRDLARSRRSYAEVRSPADGVVLNRFVTVGSFVSAANPRVVALYDPKDLQARVDVRQENAGRVRIGQQVELATEAEPDRTYRGEVIRVEPLADLKKNTVQAKIRILEPGPGLHPEMICRVRFLEEERKESGTEEKPLPSVPESAVVQDGSRSVVYLVRDGRAVLVEVRTGALKSGRVPIESGLVPGDRIIVSPPSGLADGDRVTENE